MASPVLIRPLARADLDALFDERIRPFAEAWLERQAAGEVYVAVAEREGVPLGRATLDFAALAATDPGTALLRAAHVNEAYRSQSIGTLLVKHLESVAAARGFHTVQLLVAHDNPRAQALYARLGYTVRGEDSATWTFREGERRVTQSEACWVMRKSLLDDTIP